MTDKINEFAKVFTECKRVFKTVDCIRRRRR